MKNVIINSLIIAGIVVIGIMAAILFKGRYDKGYDNGYNDGYDYGFSAGVNYTLDSIPPKVDTVYIMSTLQIDSLQERLFVAEYKLGRIKAYKEIVDRNPSQIKFLKGWINRVLE